MSDRQLHDPYWRQVCLHGEDCGRFEGGTCLFYGELYAKHGPAEKAPTIGTFSRPARSRIRTVKL